MYLNPPQEDSSGENALPFSDNHSKQDLGAALHVLEQHSAKIDCIKVSSLSIYLMISSYVCLHVLQALTLLPVDTDIKLIKTFLENVLEKLSKRHKEMQVTESLLLSECHQVT